MENNNDVNDDDDDGEEIYMCNYIGMILFS